VKTKLIFKLAFYSKGEFEASEDLAAGQREASIKSLHLCKAFICAKNGLYHRFGQGVVQAISKR
jgi:hypothetical protein